MKPINHHTALLFLLIIAVGPLWAKGNVVGLTIGFPEIVDVKYQREIAGLRFGIKGGFIPQAVYGNHMFTPSIHLVKPFHGKGKTSFVQLEGMLAYFGGYRFARSPCVEEVENACPADHITDAVFLVPRIGFGGRNNLVLAECRIGIGPVFSRRRNTQSYFQFEEWAPCLALDVGVRF